MAYCSWLGAVPSCETTAKQTLRKVGKLYPTDYSIKYVQELKGDPIFKLHPELGQFTSSFVYNQKAGMSINLKAIELTQEARKNIQTLFNS